MLTCLSVQCVLGLSFAYLLCCVIIYYLISRKGFSLPGRPDTLVALVFVIALVARMIPALALPRGALYDIESFRLVAETFLKGEGVYSSPVVAGRHPYLPFQVYLIGGAMWLARVTGLPFVSTVKWAPILADAGSAVLIFFATRRLSGSVSRALSLSLLYAFNPVSVLVSAYHGQFDAESAFLLALSWYLWRFGDKDAWRIGLSAVVLGLAVLNKTWPALFLPIVLLRLRSRKQCLAYGLVTAAVPIAFTALYVIVFHEDPDPLLRRALTHAGVPGWWGPSAVVNVLRTTTGWGELVLDWLGRYSRFFVFAGVGMSYWLTRKQASVNALTTAILALYACTSGFGIQWPLWVLPFAIIAGDVRGVDWYVLGYLIFALPAYYGYNLDATIANLISFERMAAIIQVCSLPAWTITSVWVVRRLGVGLRRCVATPPCK